MKVLVVSGSADGRAEHFAEGWRRAAPGDDVSSVFLPETVPGAVRTLGAVDLADLDPEAAIDALTAGGRITIGQRTLHDGGRALLHAARQRFGGLEQARDVCAGLQALTDDPVPLRGLRGAGARRAEALGDAAALEEDRAVGEYADSIERELARQDLLESRPVRWSLEPYSGAGGGLGFAVLALGGVLQHVRDGAAEALGLANAVGQSDLVVLVHHEFGVEELTGSAATAVADAALEAAVPVIIIVTEDHTSRRQRADLGIVGTYSAGPGLNDVDALAQRVARTWSVSS